MPLISELGTGQVDANDLLVVEKADGSSSVQVTVTALATALAKNESFVSALVSAFPIVSADGPGLAPQIPEG